MHVYGRLCDSRRLSHTWHPAKVVAPEPDRVAFACHMVSASAPAWIGIRDRAMDATTVSIALRVDRARDASQMSRYTLHQEESCSPNGRLMPAPSRSTSP